MQKPSVGRIVHYKSYGTPGGEYKPECRAAVVTEVDGLVVGLAVLNPSGMFFNRSLAASSEGCVNSLSGCWHWPDRQPVYRGE